LMVEADSNEQLERIQERLREKFGERVYLESTN
jgi:hypothetical protein